MLASAIRRKTGLQYERQTAVQQNALPRHTLLRAQAQRPPRVRCFGWPPANHCSHTLCAHQTGDTSSSLVCRPISNAFTPLPAVQVCPQGVGTALLLPRFSRTTTPPHASCLRHMQHMYQAQLVHHGQPHTRQASRLVKGHCIAYDALCSRHSHAPSHQPTQGD